MLQSLGSSGFHATFPAARRSDWTKMRSTFTTELPTHASLSLPAVSALSPTGWTGIPAQESQAVHNSLVA
jgi:hypothetical protein